MSLRMQALEVHQSADEESPPAGEIVDTCKIVDTSKKQQKIPLKADEKGSNFNQNFARRQFSRHLRIRTKAERQNKMVQTFITGNFFVSTSNVYSGELVE